jgi:hypothetical protein
MKIRPVGAKLFHADGRTNMRNEVNLSFFGILRTRLEMTTSSFKLTFIQNKGQYLK